MYLAGPANITISDNNLAVFGTTSESFPPILFTSSAGCNPTDSLTQTFRVERTKLNLAQVSDNSRWVSNPKLILILNKILCTSKDVPKAMIIFKGLSHLHIYQFYLI